MPNSDLLPSVVYKINENQLALEAHGSADVADGVRGALDTIDKNEELITLTLAVLMSPERELTGNNRPKAAHLMIKRNSRNRPGVAGITTNTTLVITG